MKNEEAVNYAGLSVPCIRGLDIKPIGNWHVWRELWSKAEYYEQYIGLLHTGFGVTMSKYYNDEPEYREQDRFEFYLAIARGWNTGEIRSFNDIDGYVSVYGPGHETAGQKSRSVIRCEIAEKAFDVFCQNVFKRMMSANFRSNDDYVKEWTERVLRSGLLNTLMDFFHPAKGEFSPSKTVLANLQEVEDCSHSNRIAIDFLLSLARFLWTWREKEIVSWYSENTKTAITADNEKCASLVKEGKLWMFEVLAYLGKIDVLNSWNLLLDLDDSHIAKLKEIAFRKHLRNYYHLVSKDRLVNSLEEAVFAGSSVARFLLVHGVCEETRKKLSKIQEAEREVRELELKLQELKANTV